jgi:hypothetical protein
LGEDLRDDVADGSFVDLAHGERWGLTVFCLIGVFTEDIDGIDEPHNSGIHWK